MSIPAQSGITIQSLINKVAAWLQNRQDVTESQTNPEMRPSAWLRDTLRELSANYDFPDLQKSGPLVNVGPGLGYQGSNFAYPVSQFLATGDDVTLQYNPIIFLTPGQAKSQGYAVTTSNTVGYPMTYMDPTSIQSLLFIPGGVPFRYTRFQNQFWFGTQPGSTYQVYLPYQVRHPFDENNLTASPVLVPPDWFDIVAIGAAERGAYMLRWNEQGAMLHNIIHGDEDFQNTGGAEGKPGLIAQRKLQMERDLRLSPVMLTPVVGRY